MSSRREFLVRSAMLGAASLVLPSFSPLHAASRVRGEKRMALTFRPYDLKLNHTFTIANYSRTTTPVVLVELAYDGFVGYGEASLPQYLGESQESVCAFLRQVDLSQFSSPFMIEDILEYVDKLAPRNSAAKASVDIALHDLVGKLMDQPWHRIWGLNPDKCPYTSFTIGIDSEEVVKAKTLEADPYAILKIKVGRESDEAMIRAIRSVTGKPLYVDANQGWKSKEVALEKIYWLKEQGVLLVEQPLHKDNLDDHAWLTERSPLPIVADESVQRLADLSRVAGAFSAINIKLMKSTGMREAWQMVQTARALKMGVMIGCMTETSCAISAAAQLSPAVDWADLDGSLLIGNDCFDGFSLKQGRIALNNLPGIGITEKKTK